MKIKRIIIVIGLILLGSMLIVACGTPPVEAPAEEAPAEEAPAEEAPAEEAPAEEEMGDTAKAEGFNEPSPRFARDLGYGGEPEMCDPDNPVLTPLVDDPQRIEEVDSAVLDGGTSLTVEYVNENGQTFQITATSLDTSAALEYLMETTACFEAIEVGSPSFVDASSPPLNLILYETLTAYITAEELQVIIADYIQSVEEPTIAGMLEEQGIDPDEPLGEVMAAAEEWIKAALEEGRILEDEAEYLLANLEEFYTEAFYRDQSMSTLAGEIYDPAHDDYDPHLRQDPENVVIEMEWADAPEEGAENYMVFYALDPTVSQQRSHWYDWERSSYVDARLYAYTGRPGTYIYRWDGCYQYRTGRSKTATGWSNRVWDSSDGNMWYRLRVFGWHGSNRYYLSGSWRGPSFRNSTSLGFC